MIETISKAIKEQKWLSIQYINSEEMQTEYWIAIKDIDIERKSFFVDAFNFSKIDNETNGIIQIWINFDKIKTAHLIENSIYEQPPSLLKKIVQNIQNLAWLSYDSYNDEILDYIKECMKHEEVPYQTETALVNGIDQEKL